jgi:putative DNA primase/helicase
MDNNQKADTATLVPATLAKLQKLLGEDVVFLPIPKGEKGPKGLLMKNWPDFNIGHMSNPKYLGHFIEDGNMGVMTGWPSNKLIGIDFDDDDALGAFLDLNPELRETATVKGQKGAKLFVRTDRVPKNGKIRNESGKDIGDLLSDGKQGVVHGTHPDGMKYQWVCEKPPASVDLDSLELPDGWTVPWIRPVEDQIADKYGRPYQQLKDLTPGKLNESFWAGLLYAKYIIMFESGERSFYKYNPKNGLWQSVTDHELKRDLGQEIYRFAAAQPCSEDHEPIRQKVNDNFLSGCINRLKSLAEKNNPFGRRDSNVIHLANGMFDLEEDQLLSFSPEYYSRNQIPIPYNPEAVCPRFVGELLGGMMGSEDITLFQKVFGGFLLPENLPQIITMIYGEASAGKSTLVNVCLGILGDDYIGSLRLKYIDSRFELGRLITTRLLTAPDIPPNFLDDNNAQALKAMTGGDTLEAELKGSNSSFKVQGTFHVVITGNSRPIVRIQNDRDAWKRRLVPFEIKKLGRSKSIPNFDKLLIEEEGQGMLFWAIRGAQMLREEIEQNGKLALSASQETRVNDLLHESESLRYFLRLYVTKETTGSVTTDQIQARYAEMCMAKKWTPVKDSTFRAQLPDLMQEMFYVSPSHSVKVNGGEQRGYRGIRLHTLQGALLD